MMAQEPSHCGASGGQTRFSHRLTIQFDSPLPVPVYLGNRAHGVTAEALRPLACFKRQKLSHKAANYRCAQSFCWCSQSGHMGVTCTSAAKCVQCRGSHTAAFSACLTYVAEVERHKFIQRGLCQTFRLRHRVLRGLSQG